MIQFRMSFFAGLLFLLGACTNHPKPAPDASPSLSADSSTANFFPVADFLRSEIAYVDSTPLAIHQFNIQNNKTDSFFIQRNAFDDLAIAFLPSGLSPDSLKKNYTESSFFDKTTGYLGFTYSTTDGHLPLQRVDVLSTSDNGHTKVKSIYLELSYKNGDTLLLRKMYWQVKHNFLIINSQGIAGQSPVVTQQKVIWDTGEEEE